MDLLTNPQNGVIPLLAGIAVVLSLQLVVRVGQFVFDLVKRKSESSDSKIVEMATMLQQNTVAVNELRSLIRGLERELSEIHKYRMDTQKLFSAVKLMAGKKWPEIRKAMEDDIFPK